MSNPPQNQCKKCGTRYSTVTNTTLIEHNIPEPEEDASAAQ